MSDTVMSDHGVMILGAGYAGLMAALRLGRAKTGERIALVSESDHFFERIRLQEMICHPVMGRLPPLGELLAGTGVEFIQGRVVALDPASRRVGVDLGGVRREFGFVQAIYALGSGTDADSIPGVAAHAYRLERGAGVRAVPALRAALEASAGRPLRVVVVGGANTAVEAAGEIKTTWPAAAVTMVSRSRCGDFGKGEAVARTTRAALAALGIDLIDHQPVLEVRDGEVVTSSGMRIAADICVWCGGLRAPALAAAAGLAVDERGRILVDPFLRSTSHPHITAVGDAARPIAPTGAHYRLSVFAAFVSAAYAADRLIAERAGRPVAPFSFSSFGQGVAIGRGGIGFTSYPDDRSGRFVLTGRAAHRVRNFFVWFTVFSLKLERRFPGAFWWPGKKRVSREQAEEAMRERRAAPRHSPLRN